MPTKTCELDTLSLVLLRKTLLQPLPTINNWANQHVNGPEHPYWQLQICNNKATSKKTEKYAL